MNTVLWLIVAWIGGTALILGSLMTIASFLFWLLPTDSAQDWQNRVKVTGAGVGLAIVGFVLLRIVPFPSF